MPLAETKALIAEIAAERHHVDILVRSITAENEQLREQCRGASEWISRHSSLSAMLVNVMLEIKGQHDLSKEERAALDEYERLHGTAVRESAKLRKLAGE